MIDCQASPRPPHAPGGMWREGRRLLRPWRAKAQGRRVFAFLDSRDLRDLGWSHQDVERELVRRFWRG